MVMTSNSLIFFALRMYRVSVLLTSSRLKYLFMIPCKPGAAISSSMDPNLLESFHHFLFHSFASCLRSSSSLVLKLVKLLSNLVNSLTKFNPSLVSAC